MPAELIWDSLYPDKLTVPERMGKPAPHQLQGSPLDNLAELAGRVCYDSLGSEKSRSSKEYHQHIREVKHLSVYRHCVFTVVSYANPALWLNRPGIWVRQSGAYPACRVTLNLQHVIEWGRVNSIPMAHFDHEPTGSALVTAAKGIAPLSTEGLPENWLTRVEIVPPEVPEERWLSFYVHGVSRGLTHELVRHGAYTAPSQRSTRYCDESESDWAWHPLIRDGWVDQHGERRRLSQVTYSALNAAQEMCQDAYQDVVREMLAAGGVDRKQARGAARGVLGNALETELIFSASLARWREIHALRNSPMADGEIRELFAQIGEQLPA